MTDRSTPPSNYEQHFTPDDPFAPVHEALTYFLRALRPEWDVKVGTQVPFDPKEPHDYTASRGRYHARLTLHVADTETQPDPTPGRVSLWVKPPRPARGGAKKPRAVEDPWEKLRGLPILPGSPLATMAPAELARHVEAEYGSGEAGRFMCVVTISQAMGRGCSLDQALDRAEADARDFATSLEMKTGWIDCAVMGRMHPETNQQLQATLASDSN
jgi:hypothetical protein